MTSVSDDVGSSNHCPVTAEQRECLRRFAIIAWRTAELARMLKEPMPNWQKEGDGWDEAAEHSMDLHEASSIGYVTAEDFKLIENIVESLKKIDD